MAADKQTIIDEIEAHINKRGGSFIDWYVGITKNARDRLFTDHRVKEKGDCWIHQKANSSQIARDVEDYFVNSVGTDGGPGGGDDTADIVYAYKKAAHTKP